MSRTGSNTRLFALLFAILSPLAAIAQSNEDKELATQLVEIGDEIMKSTRAIDQARDSYEQAAQLDPSNIYANYMAGLYRLQTIHKELAAGFFEQVRSLDETYKFNLEYLIAESYHFGENFEKAIIHYEAYLAHLEANAEYQGEDLVEKEWVEKKIEECRNGIDFLKSPAKKTIVNLGGRVNSEFDDFGPVLNETENVLIFTSRRRDDNLNEDVFEDNLPYEDIFYSNRQGNDWGYAENIGGNINTPFHDSNLAMSRDGLQLFIYKDIGNGNIFVSNKDPRTELWSEPEPLSDNINTANYTESSLTLSDDGKTIIFSSDKLGGEGGFDLYYSRLNEQGEWGPAINMGKVINTPYPEDGPFLDHDGKTLFFSSEGHKNMGGYDIFRSEYDSARGEWSQPVNLGYPINTADNDIFYVTSQDGNTAYYASVKMDGFGFLDLYKIVEEEVVTEDTAEAEVPKMPVILRVTVKDNSTGEGLDASLKLINTSNNQVAGVSTLGSGTYEFVMDHPEKAMYRLEAESTGYLFNTLNIDHPGPAEDTVVIERTIRLRKPQTNSRMILRNIYFEFDKATFKEQSLTELNKLTKLMLENQGMNVEISGHTDNIGSAQYNKELSQKRANAVKSFLVDKGIDPRRISSVGYGEERPLASNDDEMEGREINRRVEFKVTN